MKMPMGLIVSVVIFSGCGGSGSNHILPAGQFDHTYSRFGNLLSQYVVEGRVNYAELKKHKDDLNELLDMSAKVDLTAATREQRLAFYINTYNMIVLASITELYPIDTLTIINHVMYDTRWPVAGENLTLNDIAHDKLPYFNDPRVCCALSSGTNGSPPLASWPYLPDLLDIQLDGTTQYFATSESYNFIDPVNHEALLSPILNDFNEYFHPEDENATIISPSNSAADRQLQFILSYFPEDEREFLMVSSYRIDYFEYDRSLNQQIIDRSRFHSYHQ